MDLFIASPPGRVVNTVRGCRRTPTRGQLEGVGFVPQGEPKTSTISCNSRSRRLALPYGLVIGDIVDVLRAWEAAVPILIKPFLYVIAFRPIAVLFASAIGLVCWLLITCVRAIAWLPTAGQRLRNSANLPRRRTSSPAPMWLCSYAQSPPRQRPAEGHGGARPRPRGRSGHRRQRREPGGRFASKAKEQPRALTHAPGATMPGADAPRQPMPVACDEKRSLSDARRAIAGRSER